MGQIFQELVGILGHLVVNRDRCRDRVDPQKLQQSVCPSRGLAFLNSYQSLTGLHNGCLVDVADGLCHALGQPGMEITNFQ